MTRVISADEFDDLVLNNTGKVLVDFYAPWCVPCQILGPVISELGDEYRDYDVYKFDVDSSDELSRRYRIHSVPTLIRFEKGEPVDRRTGLYGKSDIREFMA